MARRRRSLTRRLAGAVTRRYRLVLALARGQRIVRVAFAPRFARHVYNMQLVAARLKAAGDAVAFIELDDGAPDETRKALQMLGLPSIRVADWRHYRVVSDLLVVMNDSGPVTSRLVEDANRRGIVTVAMMNATVNFVANPKAYQRVRHVLAVGEFDAKRLRRSNVQLVGFPRLDALIAAPVELPRRPVVVVNSGFPAWHYGGREGADSYRRDWLGLVAQACRQIGIDLVVSRHPLDEGTTGDLPVATSPILDLLRTCSVLVSSPSTTMLEAMALGVPVVRLKLPGRPTKESDAFDDPVGAFRIATTAGELSEAILEALSWVGDYRARCAAFFRLHVAVDSHRTMTERATDALRLLLPSVAGWQGRHPPLQNCQARFPQPRASDFDLRRKVDTP